MRINEMIDANDTYEYKIQTMTPNLTKEEIDDLEREVQKQRKERERRIRRAVNPRY